MGDTETGSSTTIAQEALWFPRQLCADLTRYSVKTFDDKIRRALPASAIRGEGKSLRFYGPEVVATHAKQQQERSSDDPLLDGVDSPGLERYRAAKADITEMERDRLRKQLVKVDEIEPALQQLAGVLRDAGERLARQYGNEAAGILNEAVDEFARGVDGLLISNGDEYTTDNSGDGSAEADLGEHQGAEAPHDAAVR